MSYYILQGTYKLNDDFLSCSIRNKGAADFSYNAMTQSFQI